MGIKEHSLWAIKHDASLRTIKCSKLLKKTQKEKMWRFGIQLNVAKSVESGRVYDRIVTQVKGGH